MDTIERVNHFYWTGITDSQLDSGKIVCGANNLLFVRFQRKRSSRNDGVLVTPGDEWERSYHEAIINERTLRRNGHAGGLALI